MDVRNPRALGSAITLSGLFVLGWVLHQVFVQGVLDLVAPPTVLVAFGSLLVVAAGRRIERGSDPESDEAKETSPIGTDTSLDSEHSDW